MSTHHPQIPQRTHYIVVIAPASPTSCQGSPGISALNCGRLIVSVPSMFLGQANLPLFKDAVVNVEIGQLASPAANGAGPARLRVRERLLEYGHVLLPM
jgi:hypothetical protein